MDNTSSSTSSPIIHLAIQVILDDFVGYFASPYGLPPQCITDHQIILHPRAGPVKVWPYHYPYHYKDEIAKLVDSMLFEGIIQPSRSPFSSPLILVRKHDGSWRFCVIYQALNEIMSKDAYTIPTVDEVFDDLHGAKYFSKIDLQAGFHQI